ncbi:hypothetical protein NBT05_18105 [Aquimarina sp. ERC-38]|uniref:hypothetical protein n=1 Tax=Aquimarina sp. ERC-38 TaxID=2949996 RepID=UPI00224874C2|nr:hypothetical protein [Aquimarina sp. ERC-38]UZO80839.1 hypothetical protein NBT05_18105 [Aquimarina sp. ERC-38]
MFRKGYVLTFIGLLAFIIALQQPSYVPNQEIVLQFDTTTSYQSEAKRTLATVQRELRAIGITKVAVFANKENRSLTLSYYSDNAVTTIEKRLASSRHIDYIKDKETSHQESGTPFKQTLDYDYTVAVHKIDQDAPHTKITSQLGILQFERIKIDPLQLKNHLFFSGYTYADAFDKQQLLKKTFFTTYSTFFPVVSILPDTRAGPVS